MELRHLLTRSVLTYPEVSSKVYHDSFCQSDSSVSYILNSVGEIWQPCRTPLINKGVRQGCHISLTLFNIYLYEIITKRQNQDIAGIKL